MPPQGQPVYEQILIGIDAVMDEITGAWSDLDMTNLADSILEQLKERHRQFFASGEGPDGPWQPLSPVTVAIKGHDTILVDTGALRDSLSDITEHSIQEVNRGRSRETGRFMAKGSAEILFGTMDPKSQYHQFGQGVPERIHVDAGLDEIFVDDITGQTAIYVVEELKE